MRVSAAVLATLLLAAPAMAAPIGVFPKGFTNVEVPTNGTTLHVRKGGQGPAVVLLHGFGDTGDMWAPVAETLMAMHTVIVPDLRGMGMSAHPDAGYTKANEARDIAGVMDALNIQKADLVTHDIGNMVGYALAAQYPARITKWVVIDAPLPGIGAIWQAQLSNPKTWHFNFYGPDVERLVAGRERILLDRFYNELGAHPERITEATRVFYAKMYAKPRAMHDAFEQFHAFPQDGIDNRAFLAKGKLAMPVLALGAEKSYGLTMKTDLDQVATNVKGGVVPDSGHWVMEENPAGTTKLVTDFLSPMKLGLFFLLLATPAIAVPMQNDCRGPGSIGTALMSADGTITLNLRQSPGAPVEGVAAVRRGDPNYARILAHLSGMSPGEKKSVPPWC